MARLAGHLRPTRKIATTRIGNNDRRAFMAWHPSRCACCRRVIKKLRWMLSIELGYSRPVCACSCFGLPQRAACRWFSAGLRLLPGTSSCRSYLVLLGFECIWFCQTCRSVSVFSGGSFRASGVGIARAIEALPMRRWECRHFLLSDTMFALC